MTFDELERKVNDLEHRLKGLCDSFRGQEYRIRELGVGIEALKNEHTTLKADLPKLLILELERGLTKLNAKSEPPPTIGTG